MIELYPQIIEVLEYVKEDGNDSTQRGLASGLFKYFKSFPFVFHIHLMILVLGITESLSQSLQKKDQDLLNAISIVKTTKNLIQEVRDEGWNSLVENIFSFCETYGLTTWNLDDEFIEQKRKRSTKTIRQHLQVDRFYVVLDTLLQELNDRFNETNSELILCMACLDPTDFFFFL